MEITDGGLGPAFLGEKIKELQVLLVFRAQGQKIELTDEFLADRFGENDFVDAPLKPVGEHHPIDALVGGVVDGLFDLRVLELDPGGLGLDENLNLVFEFDRQIAEGATDGELAGDLEVFVVAEDLGADVV